jgi:hypothetical protein
MREIEKSFFTVVLIALAVTYGLDASADEDTNDENSNDFFDRSFWIGIGIGYERFDTNLKLTDNQSGGSVFVDLESSLGLAEEKAIPLIYGYYRPNNKHGFGWYFSRVRRDGDILAIDANFGDLNVTGIASISDRTSFYDLTYNYTVYEDDRAFVFASFGVYGLDLGYNLRAVGEITFEGEPVISGVYEENINTFAPLPLIGIDTWFALTPKWSLGTKVSIVAGSYDDVSAFVFSTKIRAAYTLSDQFAVDFGVNYFDADVTIEGSRRRTDLRYAFSGFRLGLTYRF